MASVRSYGEPQGPACLWPAPAPALVKSVQGDGRVTTLAISGTGLYTPPQAISNDELVAAFNTYARKTNAANAAVIAAGTATAIVESSAEFIVKASGIKSRYVVDK